MEQRLTCATHPQQASIGRCDTCGQTLCSDCRIEALETEQTFCSESCRSASVGLGARPPRAHNRALREGLKHPILRGWKLWATSLKPLLSYGVPVSIGLALLLQPIGEVEGTALTVSGVALALGAAFSIALCGVLLSQRYSNLVTENPVGLTLRRFVPWLGTLVLFSLIVMLGYVALILPGIYLSVRLFWADEFALVHQKGPIAALRSSWELTDKAATPIFVFQFMLGLAQQVVIFSGLVLYVAGLLGLGAVLPEGSFLTEVIAGTMTALFAFIGYGAMHAPEIVKFYGIRAARASLDAGELSRADWLSREKDRPL